MEWCVKRYSNGSIGYSRCHKFNQYFTLILKREMYYCKCGAKITPEEYAVYTKWMDKRREIIDVYLESLK